MKKAAGEGRFSRPGASAPARVLGIAAVAAASAMIVALAARPIGGHDIGYHLAYGEHFLKTGGIVQTNRFIYTRLREDILARPGGAGPGCRYDAATRTYSFVNANWLSQVVMASVHHLGGMVALSLLQVALVAGIFSVLIVTLRRGGVAWHWIAAAVMLGALTAHERFALRPELLGYLLLVGQFALLLRPTIGWRRSAGIIALQVLAVNSHSYFLLGIALSGAMFADAFLRWLWARSVTRADTSGIRPRLKWLGVAAGGAVLASLSNPWFVRGAVMPIRTLVAVEKGQFVTLSVEAGQRKVPASTESSSPLLQRWRPLLSTRAYKLTLALAAAGALAALARRRWGWLAVLIGITLASLKMRRNIALAGIIVLPLGAIAIRDGWDRLAESVGAVRLGRIARAMAAAVPPLAMAAAGLGIYSVVTNKLYFAERNRGRFRLGPSRVSLPLDAAGWISTHRPAGRVFCDFTTSSNLMYFTSPHVQVPVLTNTWAYPPYVLQWIVDCSTDPLLLAKALEEYGVGTIVLNPNPGTRRVGKYLSASPDWAVVQVGPKYVVFLRRDGPNAALARDAEITEAALDLPRHIERIRKADPVPAHALHTEAMVLFWLGWLDPARAMWQECTRWDREFYEPVYYLGVCSSERASGRMALYRQHLRNNEREAAVAALREATDDLRKAASMMQEALKIKPDYAEAKTHLRIVREHLAALQQHALAGTER